MIQNAHYTPNHPQRYICIYHDNCLDGFGARWAFYDRVVRHMDKVTRESVEWVPAQYGNTPPDVTGAWVVILDFSYRREVIDEMAKVANTITIIDHHKTAVEDLTHPDWGKPSNVNLILDLNKSGCVLTFEAFNDPNFERPVPHLLSLIQDRDLWRFVYPETKAVLAALEVVERTVDHWDIYMGCEWSVSSLELMGKTLLEERDAEIKSLLEHRSEVSIDEWVVPVCNIPKRLASEAGNILATGAPFSASYDTNSDDKSTLVTVSLRSCEDGEDVAEIAKRFGGGGHKHAAGFKTSLEAITSGCYSPEYLSGGIAQRLEHGAHNALVGGSNPSAPTTPPPLHPSGIDMTIRSVTVDQCKFCIVDDVVGGPPRVLAKYTNDAGRNYFMYFTNAMEAVEVLQTLLVGARSMAAYEIMIAYPDRPAGVKEE